MVKQVIDVTYTSQISTYNKFRIKLRIPNYFGYVKDVRARFNRLGEKPGQYGTCNLNFSKEESTDKESVFIGSREFKNVGYMTFYVELTINDTPKRIVRDPISYNPVFAKEDNMPFFEMFVYHGNASVPEGYAGGIMYLLIHSTEKEQKLIQNGLMESQSGDLILTEYIETIEPSEEILEDLLKSFLTLLLLGQQFCISRQYLIVRHKTVMTSEITLG